jgi:di/tricarboxylate transporter
LTLPILILLGVLGLALILFTTEWIPPDVTALGVLLALILTRLVPAETAFAGFGSETVLMLLGLLILTAGLVRTGVVDLAGGALLRYTADQPRRQLVVVMLGAATLSAFMSNTASTAFFLPVVIGLARRTGVSASRLLLPLAFASILTSSVTLISTSTNLVVSGLIRQYDLPPIGMFELTPVGLPIAAVGLAYMLTVGARLLPNRDAGEDGLDAYTARLYLTEVLILPNSPLIGRTLAQSGLGSDLDLNVVRVVRGEDQYLAPEADMRLEDGDTLLVEGRRERVLQVKDRAGIDIRADVTLAGPDLQSDDVRLVEVIILPRSPLIGRTLRGFRFRERYGLQVLALSRMGDLSQRKISQVPLRMGDLLLVQGPLARLQRLAGEGTVRVLGSADDPRPNVRRAPLALAIFGLALIAAALNWLSLPVALLLGAFACFVTRCLTPEEAYREVEWKALILVGCMLALGAAMANTGAAALIAGWIVGALGGGGPLGLLTAFFVLTVLLTQPMSNQAAAAVVLPIALATALQLNLNPRTFAMMIAVAASTSYLTPLEPACLMVYGPGRYRFMDFLKVGAPLTVLIYAVALALVPLVWPLTGS